MATLNLLSTDLHASNGTFVSKVIGHAVSKQLHKYLTDYELLPRYQSAYRRRIMRTHA